MSQQFDARKANPQKTDSLSVSGLLQRSSTRSIAAEHDQNFQPLSTSSFRRNFSQVPARPPVFQPKLQVGQPGDRYEQEADRAADRVMQSSSPVPAIGRLQLSATAPLQRQPAADEEKKKAAKEVAHKAERKKQEAEKEKVSAEEKAVKADKDKHDKENKKKEDEPVQAQAEPGQAPTVTPALEQYLSTRQGNGQPLPESTRTFMESRFHHDFSQVRVHPEQPSTQALHAKAFTRRQDIFFNPTHYRPETATGQHLLAHELTHVVQQGAAPPKTYHSSKTR
ncbi:DUF4157 domain-containing protein [Leptolyngbya sp. FACHB-17]|uniref:eCIS core domain-containing protein n=1 Tax=unclassified Leptolyngbya TaxID=2650499 RepID=UPI0016819EC9|nr:DUF4157 domain-containing protein [Leptolyngbya sp. FACHB-17]MBD2080954.1 DUF4157 domain-containing protein [Leptolyngbya sp. FACHB-17]